MTPASLQNSCPGPVIRLKSRHFPYESRCWTQNTSTSITHVYRMQYQFTIVFVDPPLYTTALTLKNILSTSTSRLYLVGRDILTAWGSDLHVVRSLRFFESFTIPTPESLTSPITSWQPIRQPRPSSLPLGRVQRRAICGPKLYYSRPYPLVACSALPLRAILSLARPQSYRRTPQVCSRWWELSSFHSAWSSSPLQARTCARRHSWYMAFCIKRQS